jgi:hypothetical protein
MEGEDMTTRYTRYTLTFHPVRALIKLALFVFVTLNAPWYVTVAAVLMAVEVEFER